MDARSWQRISAGGGSFGGCRVRLNMDSGGLGGQHLDFEVGENYVGGQFGGLSPQQGHQHDAPSDDEPDCDCPLEADGSFVSDGFNSAATLQYPMPVFDTPA